jgi:hypothetical protein
VHRHLLDEGLGFVRYSLLSLLKRLVRFVKLFQDFKDVLAVVLAVLYSLHYLGVPLLDEGVNLLPLRLRGVT